MRSVYREHDRIIINERNSVVTKACIIVAFEPSSETLFLKFRLKIEMKWFLLIKVIRKVLEFDIYIFLSAFP